MLLHNVLSQVTIIAQSIFNTVERHFKAWIEPVSGSMVGGIATDLVKSKPQVILENALLRQQVIVSNRQVARPQLTTKRIQGELLKLGIRVNKGTVWHYMWQVRRTLPPQRYGQSWATFLANHAAEIWACDFVQTFDLFFRTVFLFFIIEHGSRRLGRPASAGSHPIWGRSTFLDLR